VTSRPLPLATPPPRPAPRAAVAGGWARLWFNLTRTHAALLDLARAIGIVATLRVLSRLVGSSRADPLAALGPPGDEAERLSRRQLRLVLRLDAALRAALPDDVARAALERVVTRGGARFLRYSLRLPSAARWSRLEPAARRALVERSTRPFFNMQAVTVDDPTPGAQVAFDVQACWFARLTHDLGRGDLAPLFCAADSVFFDDPAVAVGLRRDETLAAGAPRCSFRLAFKGV
jgi:hypothetical protein